MRIPVDIRWMIRRDMPEVMAIERATFPQPWTDDDFTERLRQRSIIGMVAISTTYDESVLGFMVYDLCKHRIELLNFAVHPDFRRM